MIRKLLAIIVLVMVASLSVAGCTTTNNTTQTSSAAPKAATQHDAFLEKYLTTYQNLRYSNSSLDFKAWELTWINSTSARLQETVLAKTTNRTVSYDETFILFPTTLDATNYLNAMNTTAYSLASTEYTGGGAYQGATGHAPQIYKQYVWNEGNPSNISEYEFHMIEQIDTMVAVTTAKILS